jgi:hypothetical protein
MNGLRLRKTARSTELHSNSFHNKILFPLQKLLSNKHYTSSRIQKTNTMKLHKAFRFSAVLFLLGILSISGAVFAQEYNSGVGENETEYNRLISLLSGYLANDLQLQSLSVTAQSASLSLKKSNINNGIALSLSTGDMVLKTSSSGTTFTVEPTASLSLPEANNTAVSLTGTADVSSDETVSGLENVSLSVSTDVISGSTLTRKVTLLKAARTLLEAERAVQDRAVSAEKEFYTELKTLLSQASTVLADEQTLYEDQVDFKTVVAQGYAKTSSAYRTADLAVRTDTRTLEEAKRLFVHKQTVFAKKCGVASSASTTSTTATTSFDTAWAFLPTVIPSVAGLDVSSFDKSTYTTIESAQWSKYIGGLTRDADKDLTLSASAGYTFNNSTTDSNTVDTGLKLSWKGLTAKAGISVPVSSEGTSPAYTLGFSFTPSGIALADINAQQKVLDAKLEDLAVASAEDDYSTDVVSQQTTLSDLVWAKQSDAEEYQLYTELEKDTASWYKQGVVTESDYKSAQVNKEKARITCLVNAAEFIIYNDTTKLLFHTNDGTANTNATTSTTTANSVTTAANTTSSTGSTSAAGALK